jgi:hypothetical protein
MELANTNETKELKKNAIDENLEIKKTRHIFKI